MEKPVENSNKIFYGGSVAIYFSSFYGLKKENGQATCTAFGDLDCPSYFVLL